MEYNKPRIITNKQPEEKTIKDWTDEYRNEYFIINEKTDLDKLKYNTQIKYVIIDDNFNDDIEKFPPFTQRIIIGKNYNQSLDNLPRSLTHLSLPKDYNQYIKDWPSINHLIISGGCYNRNMNTLKGAKLSSLKFL